jgi:asparagine synthase (glutamine-hydrolysing)
MCGIGGWFSEAPRGDGAAEKLARISHALNHRGPDGIKTLELDHVGMMHARLAIVDLAGGDQPMWSTDRRVVIIFNGEIFNYRELRGFYEARGAKFVTQSDTEVILAGYQDEGIEAFGRLRGMFAFALWDVAQKRGLLVRDALGIKPLFICQDGGSLYFASEVKGILAARAGHGRLDEQALHLLLNFRYLPGTSTLFRGVRQLDPGECLEWRSNGETHDRRFTPAVTTQDASLDDVLADSVRAHLVADVEVGCYLSGGIDSGLIAALTRQYRAKIPTFTLMVGDDPNEAGNAAETARLLALPNLQAELGCNEVQSLPRILWHVETPKVNAIQLFRLAELARTKTKAVLSGLGGDELFAGYNAHRIFRSMTRLPAPATRSICELLLRLRPSARTRFEEPERALRMGAALGDWPKVYALLRNIWDGPELRRWIYGPRLLDQSLPDAVDVVRERWPAERTPLEAMLEFEWRNKMVNDLLWQEDRASMAVSLEVRVPFVDLAVHAAVRKMGPPRVGKGLLREVAARHLPPQVLQRPKSGFQLDAPNFFDQQLRPLADFWLAPQRVKDYGIFNADTVAALQRLPIRRRFRWHYFLLYLMIQTHQWIEIFERGRSHEQLMDE